MAKSQSNINMLLSTIFFVSMASVSWYSLLMAAVAAISNPVGGEASARNLDPPA